MIQITAPLRLLASLGVVLALIGTAVFAAAAAPAERPTPRLVGFQDDDDDGGNATGGNATTARALPNTGTGTTAGGSDAVYQDDGNATGGNATGPRALPNTGTGTTAGASSVAYQDDGNATGGNATGGAIGNATGAGQAGAPAASHPAHIHSGTCPTLGDVVFPLTNVAAPVAGADDDDDDADDDGGTGYRGAEGAAAGLVSESEVGASLDDILAAPHAVNVHASDQDIATYVACGEVGGTVVGGQLIVGLRPLNGSGLAGIAILDDDDDDGQTDVTVYLAQIGGGDAAAPAPAAPAPAAGNATGDDDGDD